MINFICFNVINMQTSALTDKSINGKIAIKIFEEVSRNVRITISNNIDGDGSDIATRVQVNHIKGVVL